MNRLPNIPELMLEKLRNGSVLYKLRKAIVVVDTKCSSTDESEGIVFSRENHDSLCSLIFECYELLDDVLGPKVNASPQIKEKPDWWPKNPYSAVSGHLARLAWDLASEEIYKRMDENLDLDNAAN